MGFPGGSVVKRIFLPMQESSVPSLVQKDLTCHRATKPMFWNYRACGLEPGKLNYWAHMPRAHALQQEKPCKEKSAHSNED